MVIKAKFTPAEKAAIAEEFHKRVQDVIYMAGKDQAMAMVEDMSKRAAKGIKVSDTITFNFKVTMVYGDLLQVVGRTRRKQK